MRPSYVCEEKGETGEADVAGGGGEVEEGGSVGGEEVGDDEGEDVGDWDQRHEQGGGQGASEREGGK